MSKCPHGFNQSACFICTPTTALEAGVEDPIDELVEMLRVALQMNDLTLWSASGAHVFNSETALQGLARSLLARGVTARDHREDGA